MSFGHIELPKSQQPSLRGWNEGVGAQDSRRRDLYVAMGVDCDPDRDTYPSEMTWRGVEMLPRLLEIEGVHWTLNVRADTQVRDYCGSADFCWAKYRGVWDRAMSCGSAVAWHLHYFDRNGHQDTSESNILENIVVLHSIPTF